MYRHDMLPGPDRTGHDTMSVGCSKYGPSVRMSFRLYTITMCHVCKQMSDDMMESDYQTVESVAVAVIKRNSIATMKLSRRSVTRF